MGSIYPLFIILLFYFILFYFFRREGGSYYRLCVDSSGSFYFSFISHNIYPFGGEVSL